MASSEFLPLSTIAHNNVLCHALNVNVLTDSDAWSKSQVLAEALLDKATVCSLALEVPSCAAVAWQTESFGQKSEED